MGRFTYCLDHLPSSQTYQQADEVADVRRDPRCLRRRTTLNHVHHLYQRQLSLRHADRHTLQSHQRRRRPEHSHRIPLHGRPAAIHRLRSRYHNPGFNPSGHAILRQRRPLSLSVTHVLVLRSRPRSSRLESAATRQSFHSSRYSFSPKPVLTHTP